MKLFAAVVFGIIFAVAGFLGILYMLTSAMSLQPAAMAIVLAAILLPLITVLIVGSIGFIMYVRHHTPSANRPQVFEAERLPDQAPKRFTYRPFEPEQLPGSTFLVPTFTDNGVRKPYPAEQPVREPAKIETIGPNGDKITIPLHMLLRFLNCATPKRTEWTGDKAIYGLCLQFCTAQGLLNETERGGVTWKENYPLRVRTMWADQFSVPAVF